MALDHWIVPGVAAEILGFLTRLAAIPLIIDISVAIATTKVALGLQKGVGLPFMRRGQIFRCCSVQSFS